MATVWDWCCLTSRRTGFLAVLAATSMMESPTQAQPMVGTAFYGVYAEGGSAVKSSSTTSAVLGFTWSLGEAHVLWGGAATTYGDLFISEWKARRVVGENQIYYLQIGAIASARYRFAEGHSSWFADAGLGITTMDRTYQTPSHSFSTRFQFTPVLSAGRNFGVHGSHELSVRFQHFSNGGIREPNPGQNFLRLRYLYRF